MASGAAKFLDLFEEEVDIVSTFDVSSLWAKMVDEYLAEVMEFSRTEPTPDELANHMQEYMDALSDKPIDQLATESTTVAYNEGRSAAILTGAELGEFKYVIRSEILDSNTCDWCESIDNEVFEIDTDEYYANMPPADCEGGARCRGIYVIVPAGEE